MNALKVEASGLSGTMGKAKNIGLYIVIKEGSERYLNHL